MTYNVRVLQSGRAGVLDAKGNGRCWALVVTSKYHKRLRLETGPVLVEPGTRCRVRENGKVLALVV